MGKMVQTVLKDEQHSGTPDLNRFLLSFPGVQLIKGALPLERYVSLSIDTRTLQPGQPFLALRGEHLDGHQFVFQALEKGAAFVVVEADWYFRQEPENSASLEPVIVVQDTLHFLQELAAWHRSHFAIPLVGITGSAGKTTTREMLGSILARRWKVLQNQGNQNNHIGVPLTLLKLDSSHQVAVVEVGTNHPGEIAQLTRLIQPTHGIVTQIGRAHMGYFGSQQAIYQEKTALLDGLPADGVAVLNGEDRLLQQYQREDLRLVRVGFSPSFPIWAQDLEADALGRFCFRWKGKRKVQLQIPGRHHVLNALLAGAMALELGADENTVVQGLAAFQPVQKRMEVVQIRGIWFINDAYNASPDSMRAALRYLAELPRKDGHRFAALGDMLELGKFADQEHRRLLQEVRTLPLQGVALYGPCMAKWAGELEGSPFPWIVAEDHQAIARWLSQRLQPGDVVLLKGSRGMQMEKVLTHFSPDAEETPHVS